MIRYNLTVSCMLALAISIAGCDEPVARNTAQVISGPADATDTRAVVRGEAVYLTHCASCHGSQLEGQANWREALPDGAYPAPPHDGTGHTWRHTDQQLFEATKFGGGFSAAPDSVSRMPAFEEQLTDEEIWAAVSFIQSRGPAELLARPRLQSRRPSQGKHAGHEEHSGHSGNSAE
jgi:mono/diheme cytochrome c family protein